MKIRTSRTSYRVFELSERDRGWRVDGVVRIPWWKRDVSYLDSHAEALGGVFASRLPGWRRWNFTASQSGAMLSFSFAAGTAPTGEA